MIGTRERLISQGIIKNEKCKVCNQDTSLLVDVYLKFLILKIFVFPLEKRTVVCCTQCKKGDLKPFEMTSTAKNKLFKINEETKIPTRYFSGYIILTILVFLIMLSKIK